MKKFLSIFFILAISIILPAYSKEIKPALDSASTQGDTAKISDETNAENQTSELRSIFIWQIPDYTPPKTSSEDDENVYNDEDTNEIYSDKDNTTEDEEIPLALDNIPIKGYVEYIEDADAIYLKDEDQNLVLNLRVPQKLESVSASSVKLPMTTFAKNVYTRSDDLAYSIAPVDANAVAKKGNFSIGTSYNESIDTSDLGFTTSFYTKYDQKHFSLSSAYNKESGIAYSTVVDKFSFTPELKLNKYISIKDVLTSDITRNRKQNSLILSIKPTQDDRVRFEFGAGQTFDENKNMIKSELKFSTQFKW